MLLKLNDKIQWGHIIPLAGVLGLTLRLTQGKKLGKILLYNGSVAGIFLLAALIVIKYKRPNNILKRKRAGENPVK